MYGTRVSTPNPSLDISITIYTVNGERLGTYQGHQGAIWTVDVDPTTTLLATGGADNTIRLWEVRSGRCLKTWNIDTVVKRVEFSEDGSLLLGITEQQRGFLGTVVVFQINLDLEASETDDPLFRITMRKSKATVAAWSYLNKYIITGHEDGSVGQYDGKVSSRFLAIATPTDDFQTGDFIQEVQAHEQDFSITDMQMASDRTYFITASKDKTAKILAVDNLKVLKTYVADTPLNTACITTKKDFVILGGGQDARDVTTTSSRQGKFEARFYHKIFELEIGRVKVRICPRTH